MKLKKPNYIEKYIKISQEIKLESGEKVNIYTFKDNFSEEYKKEWAKHILYHYINEVGIAEGMKLNNTTRSEYIKQYVLPSVDLRKGSEMTGVFGEIVFSDFVEYNLKYNVPRYRLFNTYPGNPQQGIDIIAYKFNEDNKPERDTIAFIEVKARLSSAKFSVLQKAVDDVSKRQDKDFAVAIDFARRKLNDIGSTEEAKEMARFSDSEKPCLREKMAGLLTSADNNTFSNFIKNNVYSGVKISNGKMIETHVIYSNDLKTLVKELWEKACL